MVFRKVCVLLSIVLQILCLIGCNREPDPQIPVTSETVETTASVLEPVQTESEPTEPLSAAIETTAQAAATEETIPTVYIPWYESGRLIYHAGGAVGEMTYTNSKEAVEKTLADGNRLLEMDFLFTSDGHLVCLHEWKNFLGMTQPCTLERFLSMKIFHKFTTISAETFISYMRQYPDMYLIIDTKEQSMAEVVGELLRLCDYEKSVADRFVIQLYDRGIKAQIMELYPFGADNFLFTAYKFGADRIANIKNLCLEEDIRIVTVPYGSWNQATVQQFNDAGFYVFEHTVNFTGMTDNALARGVYGFYTDSLQESDLGIGTDD